MSSGSRMKVEDLVDMTAMVDIVFFVLIFFMVVSMQETFTSIEMPVPDTSSSSAKSQRSMSEPEKNPDSVIVRIDRDSTVWLDDTEIPSEPELRVRLRNARKNGGSSKLLVLGNSEAKHGTVVMVLDSGADAGMEEMQLAIDDES